MYKVKKILVPTDFSCHSLAAVEHAVILGEKNDAEVTLLHVDEFGVSPVGALGFEHKAIQEYQEAKKSFVADEFRKLTQHISGRSVRASTELMQGRAYKVIVEVSETEEYDLVVIATRGLTELSSHLIGGTAERVVGLSRQPVLSVRGLPQRKGKIRSILCPTDMSPSGNNALTYALSITRQTGARLYVQYTSELQTPEDESALREKLPRLEDFHPMANELTVEFLFDRDVEPCNSIIRFAEDREVDLIVMSTHGRKGLRRVYIGNNTAEVVRQASCPVLTITHPLHKMIFSRPVTEAVHHSKLASSISRDEPTESQ